MTRLVAQKKRNIIKNQEILEALDDMNMHIHDDMDSLKDFPAALVNTAEVYVMKDSKVVFIGTLFEINQWIINTYRNFKDTNCDVAELSIKRILL